MSFSLLSQLILAFRDSYDRDVLIETLSLFIEDVEQQLQTSDIEDLAKAWVSGYNRSKNLTESQESEFLSVIRLLKCR